MYELIENQPIVLLAVGAFILLVSGTIIVASTGKKRLEKNLLEEKIRSREKETALDSAREELEKLRAENVRLSAQNAGLISDVENQKKFMEEKIRYLEQNKEEMTLKFRDISNEIIKAQNRQFGEEQKNAFNLLLKPFQDQMSEFKQKVEAAHEDNIKNKSSFDEQLRNLLTLNQSLSKDAQDLSAALKGNKKLQGNWGEFQLDRVLEVSGLQKGITYFTQESFKNEDNQVLRPDVIVKLPNQRSVIIDSKVSLNDYINYVNCEDDALRQVYLKKHIQCLKNHIEELSGKEYQKLLKDSSLDYVVIFIPIESAYVEAVNADNGLYDFAYKKNIAMTTPSSLLPILRTIENLWRIENQNKNVAKIAQIGGSLYDKISAFVEDMQRIDKAIDGARKNYDLAMNKLSVGKGNALSLAARLKEQGAKASKTLSIEYDDNENILSDEAAND